LTPFEVLTLTALQLFEQAAVDIVVMEVGMGGRLDATNVIPTECILVSALTAVDLDHMVGGNCQADILPREHQIGKLRPSAQSEAA
jgi:folylpolyglutamate synthase